PMDPHQPRVAMFEPRAPADTQGLDAIELFTRGAIGVRRVAVDDAEDPLAAPHQIPNRASIQARVGELDGMSADEVVNQCINALQVLGTQGRGLADLA